MLKYVTIRCQLKRLSLKNLKNQQKTRTFSPLSVTQKVNHSKVNHSKQQGICQNADFLVFVPVSRSVLPGSEFFLSRIQGKKDYGSGSASKKISIFNPKHCFQALGNMIPDVHPGSGS
jgi:hypothetical protein